MSAELWKQFEGQSIENTYHLKTLLGSGGFGGVFLADHVVEGALIRQVAVKLILPDAQYVQRQLTELVAATNLRHDHLIACFHAGSAMLGHSKLLYLVMEVAQGTLQQRIEQGVLPWDQAMKLAADLAFALEYLHRQRHIHRDLKPANVLRVGEDWKLSDFGTMRQSAATTSHTRLVPGTPSYMPPESFDGVISPAWDIWSLGVILLLAVSGKKPYGDITEQQLLRAIAEQDPVIPPDLPAPFGEIVRGCLTRDYKSRWTARQVSESLQRFHKTRASALKTEAGERRKAGKPAAALTALREARQLDPDDTELDPLISDAERQQREEEDRQRRISLLQVEAVKATAAGRHEEALQAWRQMLLLDPADEDALAAVREFERKKRTQQVQEMRKQAGEAVAGGDYSRGEDLIRQLQVGTAPPKTPVKIARRSRLAIGLAISLLAGGLAWLLFKPAVSSRGSGPPDPAIGGSAPKTEPPSSREPPAAPPQRVRTNLKDGLPYAWIPPGKFTMGCSPGDSECFDNEKPPHAEQIANGFRLGQTVVTQAAWKKVMGGDNPSYFKGDRLPVEQVDWNQASAYCKAIGGRLPTEKEWEYAARAGSTAVRYGPLDAIAWYSRNSGSATHPVGLKQANAYGLYDMLGNVWEWTSDDYDAEHKVVRGGSWGGDAGVVRASVRGWVGPADRSGNVGFRCVGEFQPSAPATGASAPKIESPASREPPPEETRAAPAQVLEKPPKKPSAQLQRVLTIPKAGLPYVWIPPGNFIMGCSPGDNDCSSDEKPPHAEQIPNGFWIGQTQVTQAAWKKVMNNNPSFFTGDRLPVEQVNWSQADDYCKAIGGRLPTEAEWEYAVRAGTTGARYGPLDAIAWYSGNSVGTTHPVALKQANASGLYDMLGNVWEWTSDDSNAGRKAVRGGSWDSDPRFVRASLRIWYTPTLRKEDIGFRCVVELR